MGQLNAEDVGLNAGQLLLEPACEHVCEDVLFKYRYDRQ